MKTFPESQTRPALQISPADVDWMNPMALPQDPRPQTPDPRLLREIIHLRETLDTLIKTMTRPAATNPVALIQELVAIEFAPEAPLWRRWMIGRERYEPVATARMVAMRLCREEAHLSRSKTGRAFKRVPSTVDHAVIRIRNLQADSRFADRYANVAAYIRARLQSQIVNRKS